MNKVEGILSIRKSVAGWNVEVLRSEPNPEDGHRTVNRIFVRQRDGKFHAYHWHPQVGQIPVKVSKSFLACVRLVWVRTCACGHNLEAHYGNQCRCEHCFCRQFVPKEE